MVLLYYTWLVKGNTRLTHIVGVVLDRLYISPPKPLICLRRSLLCRPNIAVRSLSLPIRTTKFAFSISSRRPAVLAEYFRDHPQSVRKSITSRSHVLFNLFTSHPTFGRCIGLILNSPNQLREMNHRRRKPGTYTVCDNKFIPTFYRKVRPPSSGRLNYEGWKKILLQFLHFGLLILKLIGDGVDFILLLSHYFYTYSRLKLRHLSCRRTGFPITRWQKFLS
jgi:hypothetical protein